MNVTAVSKRISACLIFLCNVRSSPDFYRSSDRHAPYLSESVALHSRGHQASWRPGFAQRAANPCDQQVAQSLCCVPLRAPAPARSAATSAPISASISGQNGLLRRRVSEPRAMLTAPLSPRSSQEPMLGMLLRPLPCMKP